LVDDRDVISRLAPLYRHSIQQLWETIYADRLAAAAANPDSDESVQMFKLQRSAQWLADNFEQVPLYLFGFVHADPTGGSIHPKGSVARSPWLSASSIRTRLSPSSACRAVSIG
jgi:hypothetical protein